MGKPRIGKMTASLCHRVVAGLFLITPGVLGGTCDNSQASGSVCVCSGACPSFTSSWTGGSNVVVDGNCIATQGIVLEVADPECTNQCLTPTVIINSITYNTPYDACPGTTQAPTNVGDTYAPSNAPTNAPTSNSATARGSNLATVAVVAVAAMVFEYLA